MFKRVEKRRLRREEEEELGLDEDMREVLGMHDTDSEESASDSDNSDGTGEDKAIQEDDEDEGHSGAEGESREDDEIDGEEEEDPEVTVSQALKDPIYVVSILPEVKACIVCPGKLLKGAKMVQLHRISNAHERRSKQFKALATDAEPDESAWEVLQRGSEEKPKLSLTPSQGATSKRAEKKKAQAAKLKLRREKAKAKRSKEVLKKKAAPASNASSVLSESASDPAKPSKKDKAPSKPTTISPPKKKRRVTGAMTTKNDVPSKAAEQTSSALLKKLKKAKNKEESEAVALPASPVNDAATTELKEAVKHVARSISDRAKNARQRATTTSKVSKEDSRLHRKKYQRFDSSIS